MSRASEAEKMTREKYCIWHQAYADEAIKIVRTKTGATSVGMTVVTQCGHNEKCTKYNWVGRLLKDREGDNVKCPFCHKLIWWRNVYGGEGEM